MQTLPEFRRKGYGILLANRLTAAVRQRGYIPFVVIRPENAASQSLYLKLGFKKHYQTIRAVLNPKSCNTSEIPNGKQTNVTNSTDLEGQLIETSSTTSEDGIKNGVCSLHENGFEEGIVKENGKINNALDDEQEKA